MRVLVCGGRDYADYPAVKQVLDAIHVKTPITRLIHGDARGADHLAERWARWHFVAFSPYPANWSLHGGSAGRKRNQVMLDDGKPDLVIAFPGGRGTADMVRRAKAAGVPVREIAATGAPR